MKFYGNDNWIRADVKTGEYLLPTKRVENLELEAIDASFMLLLWEGFENLTRLERIRFLSLANGFYINDWCLNRVQQFSKSLEFLDLSNCKRISAQGLSALVSCKNLKFLRLDGLDGVKNLAKVALALEEAIPNLQILGLDYDKALNELNREMKLMENPNVFEDARGNLHLKDRSGEFYFLKGNLTNFERPIFDELGLPLYMSRIRRDLPDLPPEEVEKLNRLVDGKLKHLLVGSPSGEWTVETERLLSFEAYRKWKIGEQIEPILLPESMKDPASKETFVQKIRKFLPFGSERAVSLPAPAPGAENKPMQMKPDDAPISHEIRSPPPKPRPPRLFGKFQRYSANYDKYPW